MTRAPLDSFESALLSELRDVVTERSATRSQPRRRKPLVVATAAATAVAASVGAVIFGVGIGGTATASAYSVKTQADGDVLVTIHRLEDAEGLERELRAHGIDADVTYDPDLYEEGEEGLVGGVISKYDPANPEGPSPEVCDVTKKPAIIAEKVGSDYRFTIPANSPLQDRPFDIATTHPSGDGVGLMAFFKASEDVWCVLGQVR